MADNMPPTQPAKGFQGRAVGAVLGRVVGAVMRKRGFRDIDVWSHWPAIVGEELAAFSIPERISRRGGNSGKGAVLTVRVEGAMAPEVQHMVPLILQRLNGHYGAGSITELKIIQGPLPANYRRHFVKPPNPAEVHAAAQALGDFPDGPLKVALSRLGARISRKVRKIRIVR